MKILRWEVQGWAGIDSVSILNPSPHLVEFFSEDNGSGKTSMLESLRGALGGAEQIGDSVIREGSSKAQVVVDLGECKVKCTVSQRGRDLQVKTGDGKPIPAAQSYLNGKVGRMLNVTQFQAMPEQDRQKLVRDLAGEEWLAQRKQLQAAYDAAYKTRADAGRDARRFGELVVVEPAEPVDVAALTKALDEATRHNQAERDRLMAWEHEQQDRRDALQRQARDEKAARDAVSLAEQALAVVLARGKDLPQPDGTAPVLDEKDTSGIRAELQQANYRNAAANAYQRYLETSAEKAKADAAHEEASKIVVRASEALEEHDRAATLPEGLAITAEGIKFNGRPLARMSTGECLAVAFKIAVARGQKVLVLDNAEALGPANVATIGELAAKHDVQVVCATRGKPHTSGAYELRNGRLVEPPAAEVKAS